MVRVSRFFAYLFFFIVMFLLFFPKENLFFAVEKELQTQKVLIANEKIEDSFFTLYLRDATIFFENMDVATLKEAKIDIFLFYNSVTVKDIRLSPMVANFFPSHISSVKLNYTLINPLFVQGVADGDFGIADLSYSLREKKLYIKLKPSQKMLKNFKTLLKMLKKEKNGEYSYEKSL